MNQVQLNALTTKADELYTSSSDGQILCQTEVTVFLNKTVDFLESIGGRVDGIEYIPNRKLEVVFDSDGVHLGTHVLFYRQAEYDVFVEIMQQHGLRGLVENVSKFTITDVALITDLQKEFNLKGDK